MSGRIHPQRFSFIIKLTRTSNITEGSRILFASDYVDGERRHFTINGLVEGESYLFSAQARNQFGSSGFSGISLPITIVTSKCHKFVTVYLCLLYIAIIEAKSYIFFFGEQWASGDPTNVYYSNMSDMFVTTHLLIHPV